MASNFTNDCRVPQGFVLTLGRSSLPFSKSLLSSVIRSNDGFKYLQIYHSVTGGEDVSAQDKNNNLRFLEWQVQEIKRVLFNVKTTVPELRSDTGRWEVVAQKMLTTVIEARRLLSSTSDWLQLKVLVEKLDDDLDIIARAFDLLVAQLELYRNRTNIENVIHRFIRLKADLPKTTSLSFSKSSIQQNFVGLRFLLIAKICHKRLCFPNMKSSIWSLHGKYCAASLSSQKAGLFIQGTAFQFVSLGNLITFPAGGTLTMFLTRDREYIVTSFESQVNLLGLKKNATIKMTGNHLSFAVWGPMFGEFDVLLNVKTELKNVVDWNSIVFEVQGTMNKTSVLYRLLKDMIKNETAMVAKESIRRLMNAQIAFSNAKRKADLAKEFLKVKQFTVNKLKVEKQRAANELQMTLLQYQMAKKRFNSTAFLYNNTGSLVCEIRECNYTCLNGCVIPGLCQDPVNVTYLEEHCETVEKPIKVKVVKSKTETRSYSVQRYKTVITGDCFDSGTSVDTAQRYSETGEKLGAMIGSVFNRSKMFGKIGYVLGAVVGFFKKSIFGCSEIRERVPDKPRIINYDHKSFEVSAGTRVVKEIKCTTGHAQKTKPGGYGPPYQCCKNYGCQTKVIDPQCVLNNDECLKSLTELKFTLEAMNATLLSEFYFLRNLVDKVKKATFSYEKARIRHNNAVTLFKHVEAHMKQLLSAVEISNASMSYVRRMVAFGLEISQALNTSNNKRIVDVGEMQFFLSTAFGDTKQIVFESNVSKINGQRTAVSFLVDFHQVERSISSASKAIITKLFYRDHSRRKRSMSENSANFTHSLHTSFTDYPFACLFVNKTQIYFRYLFQSLEELISSVKELNVNLSTGYRDLERLSQNVNLSSSISNTSSVDASNGYSNSSFATEFLEVIQVFKDENAKLTNDSFQSWNDTLEVWRAFLEDLTLAQGFPECSGTQDCIDYLLEGAKEFYEFEDSPRAREIKEALPRLRNVTKLLTSEALTMGEAEQALIQAAFILKKTQDNSVLCGGTPRITSCSQGEVILFPGDSLSLNCNARQEERLTYAWKWNGRLIGKSLNGTLNVGNISKDNEGAYICVVSNNKGSTLSNVTIVKVHSKPQITHHPKPQRVVFGSKRPVTFVCNATAEPSPSFQWFFQSPNSSLTTVNETKPVLYIADPHLHQEGYYHCQASNDHGTAVSQKARLDVLNYTVGLPRLLIAFNLTTFFRLTSNSFNRTDAYQDPLPCDSMPVNVSPSSIDKNLRNNLIRSLAKSLEVSIALISELQYGSGNTSKCSVAFVLDVENKPWKVENFTSYIEIVQAIATAEANTLEKLRKFNSNVYNKTFKVPWKTTTLLGEPESIILFPLPPDCPEGQILSGNGFICGKKSEYSPFLF